MAASWQDIRVHTILLLLVAQCAHASRMVPINVDDVIIEDDSSSQHHIVNVTDRFASNGSLQESRKVPMVSTTAVDTMTEERIPQEHDVWSSRAHVESEVHKHGFEQPAFNRQVGASSVLEDSSDTLSGRLFRFGRIDNWLLTPRLFSIGAGWLVIMAAIFLICLSMAMMGRISLDNFDEFAAGYHAKVGGRTTVDSAEEDMTDLSDDSDSEWCELGRVTQLLQDCSSVNVEIVEPSWTVDTVLATLKDFSVHSSKWTDQHTAGLASELSKGKSRLVKDGTNLMRLTDFVIVILVYEPEHLVIQEVARPQYKRNWSKSDNGQATCIDHWDGAIKSRIQFSEDLVKCADRCLREKLQMDIEGKIKINPDILAMRETSEVFDNVCPGLTCLNRKFVLEATVVTSDYCELEELGITSKALTVPGYMYTWDDIKESPIAQKHLRQKYARTRPNQGVRWNCLNYGLTPVLPWSRDEVLLMLNKYGIKDSNPFGKTIEELAFALSDGVISFGLREGSGPVKKLTCITEYVSLVTESKKGLILITEPIDDMKPHPSFPRAEKFSNENVWNAALRLAQTFVKLSAPIYQMDAKLLALADVVESNGQYEFMTREYIVSGPKYPHG